MKQYQVVGNLSADKSSEAYPLMTLCDVCVQNFEVLTTEEVSDDDPCEECGCYDKEENNN